MVSFEWFVCSGRNSVVVLHSLGPSPWILHASITGHHLTSIRDQHNSSTNVGGVVCWVTDFNYDSILFNVEDMKLLQYVSVCTVRGTVHLAYTAFKFNYIIHVASSGDNIWNINLSISDLVGPKSSYHTLYTCTRVVSKLLRRWRERSRVVLCYTKARAGISTICLYYILQQLLKWSDLKKQLVMNTPKLTTPGSTCDS